MMMPEEFSQAPPPWPLARPEGVDVETWHAKIFDILPSGLIIHDEHGIVIYANPAAAQFLGLARDQLIGRTAMDLCWHAIHEDGSDFPGDQHPSMTALRLGVPVLGCAMGVALPDEGRRWLRVDAVPTLDQDGRTERVVVSMTDITARHVAAEHALRTSEERLAHAFNEAALGMAQVDGTGRLLHVNRALSALLGYAEQELLGMTLAHVTLAEDVDSAKDLTQRSLAGELEQFQAEQRFVRRDGQIIWVRVTSRPVHDPHDGFLYFTTQFEDITARMRMRHATHELAQLRADQAAQADALASLSSSITGVLDHGTLYSILLKEATRVLPCDQATVLAYENGWGVVAATWGSPNPPVGTKLFPLDGPDTPWLPANRFTAGYVNDTTAVANWVDFSPWVDDRRIRSVLIAPFVVDGECVGALGLQSITPGRYKPEHLPPVTLLAERMSLALRGARLYAAEQERARAAEELARMRNEFVATVSHELRSPLTAIIGYGELLQAHWDRLTDGARRERVGRIVDSANRQQRLVEDLLLISRLELGALRVRLGVVKVGPLVHRAAEEVRANYRDQRIDLHGPDDLWARVDGERVTQIIVNLTDNAAKYSPENAPVAITWGAEEPDDAESPNPPAGLGVAVRVSDHGPGVPVEGRERLFERFGRLRGSRSRGGHVGTGLGLYLSRCLAEAMGGALDMESTGPSGTVFRLRLPLATEPAADSVDPANWTRRGDDHDRGRTKSRGSGPRPPV